MCFIICCDSDRDIIDLVSEVYPLGRNLWLISFENHELKNCTSGSANLVFWSDVSNVRNVFGPYCMFESIIFDVQSLCWEDISNDNVSFSILFGVGATIQLPEGWNLSFTAVKSKNAIGELFYSGTVSSSLWATKSMVMNSYTSLNQEGCTVSSFKGPYFPSNLKMLRSIIDTDTNIAR